MPRVLTEPETLGGPGTPPVAAFTPEPLAVALGCSPSSASALLADALDLHHRLPLLWDQTCARLVPAWKARRVATRTRHLSAEAVRWLDRHLAARVSSLSLPALDRLVAEAAARCDAEDLLDRETAARTSWDVVLVHPDPHRYAGTSELRATGDTLDLTRFHDVVCAEAEALGALGDTDELNVRKAKALGVIADAQARLDLTSLLASEDAAARQESRKTALDRRDAKVRLYLHASLADIVAGDSGAPGSAEGIGPVSLDRVREWAGRSRVTIQPVLHVAAEDRWSVDPTTRRRGWPSRCVFATTPASSRGAVDRRVSATSTTAHPSRTPVTEVRRGRPLPTHSLPCADGTTGPRLRAHGATSSSILAPTCGPDPQEAASSSPPGHGHRPARLAAVSVAARPVMPVASSLGPR